MRYWSYEDDSERKRREKQERKKQNLKRGFFCDKSRPYESIGDVCLETGDLIMDSMSKILKEKVSE